MELSLRDVARLLNVPDQTVTRWVRQSQLPALKIRGQYRVNKVELQEWALARNLRVSTELFAPGGHVEQLPSLSGALERGGIHFGVPGKQRDEVLGAVTQLVGIPDSLNRSLLYQLLLGRESLASTGIGGGIAIPHPRDPLVVQIDEPVVLLAFLQTLVDFESIDRQPVSVLFVLLSPSVRTHLQMLSSLMFALHDAVLRELLRGKMPAEVILKRLLELEANRTLPGALAGRAMTSKP